ncbi:MAG: hypothetical protein NDJ72_08760, partial [Elusimicrobia bacterium]|nr:hypothetical protein [Elusimicrobiota bacterium]
FVEDAERIEKRPANGVTTFVLKFGETKTCDAATWRHLASGTPRVWSSPEAGKLWDATNAGPNAAIVLVADDFFRAFDPKALKVLEAADAVIAAGVRLGVVAAADSPKPLSELLNGASGGAFGAMKPKIVTAQDKAAAMSPDEIEPVFRKLIDDKGAARAGGSAVLDFRAAVLELNAEIGRLGASRGAVAARTGADLPGVKDFMPGLPSGYVAPKTGKPEALNDAKYDSALAALIGAGPVPALEDSAKRAGSLLEPIDLGLRNLVAIRAAQVEQIVKAAKGRLNGKSVTAIGVAARAGKKAEGAKPLAAETMRQLAETPEYMRLDALYDRNLREKGDAWVNDPAAKAIDQARKDMQAAALSATLEADPSGRENVVFTQGRTKIVLGSIVPPEEGKGGDAARENAAAVIARFIVDGAKTDALFKTVAAAVGGEGEPGQTLPSGLTSEEVPVSKDVPPAIAKINADGAGCKNPKDVYRNNYESYAARKQAAAADLVSGNARSRADIEATRVKEKADSEAECKRRTDAAAAFNGDDFADGASVEAKRKAAMAAAEKWCADSLVDIEKRAAAATAKLPDPRTLAGAESPLIKGANADLEAAYGVAITGSVSTLRRDYTNPAGGPRVTKLIADAKLKGMSARLTAFVKLWFMERWPEGDELKVEGRQKALADSLGKCQTAMGFSRLEDEKTRVSYSNPENPDTVSKKCGIHQELAAWIEKKKGTVSEIP